MLLYPIKGIEERKDTSLVTLSGSGKPAFIDTIVDHVILPGGGIIDFAAERLGIYVDATVLFVNEVVKLRIFVKSHMPLFTVAQTNTYLATKHAENLAALVVHNALHLLVVQDG